METEDIKERIRNYIEHADDRLLRIMNAIIDTEENEISQANKEILDDRLKYHQENPEDGKSWEVVRTQLSDKYGV